jgi:hypothetical protein
MGKFDGFIDGCGDRNPVEEKFLVESGPEQDKNRSFQLVGSLFGKLVDNPVEGPLLTEHSVDQFGQEPSIGPLQGTSGKFAINEDIGIGTFLLDPEEDVVCGTAGVRGRHGDSLIV